MLHIVMCQCTWYTRNKRKSNNTATRDSDINEEMMRARQEQGQYDTLSDLCIFCVLGAVYAIITV